MTDENDPISHADLAERLERIEETLEPIAETWQEVVVLGRYTRIVFRSIVWTAGMVVVVMAAWNTVNP